MRTVFACAALVGVLVPAIAGAQSLNLTESAALAKLSVESPRGRVARASVEVARADLLSVGRWPNPRLTFDRESVAGVSENMFMVAQALPITGRRNFEMQAASAMVSASSSRFADDLRRLRADLRAAFADLLAAQRRERELTAARDRLQQLSDTLAKREAAGDAAGFDRLRAEREVLDLDADRVLAAADRARAQATIASFFTDVADASQITAVAPTAPAVPVPPLEQLVEKAESIRGELLALKQETTAADFSRRAADRRTIPEPEIVAGSKSSSAAGGDVGTVFTVHAAIPVFDHGRPERALAAARAAQAAARTDVFRAMLRTNIAALREIVLQRREAAERYRARAADSAGDIERIAQVSYDAGERGILELLDAYRTGASARVRQAQLEAAVSQAEIELEFVSGWEMRNDK